MKLPDSLGGNFIPLSNDNVMLRGMSLRNTPSVYGIVLYTGHQTKIQMNSSTAKYKTSRVMDQAGVQIALVLLMQIVFATVAAAFGTNWII
jgi:phospholipid-transporting ATPase